MAANSEEFRIASIYYEPRAFVGWQRLSCCWPLQTQFSVCECRAGSSRIDLRVCVTLAFNQPFRPVGMSTLVDKDASSASIPRITDLKNRSSWRQALTASDGQAIRRSSASSPICALTVTMMSVLWPDQKFWLTLMAEKKEGMPITPVDRQDRESGSVYRRGRAIAVIGAVIFSIGISRADLSMALSPRSRQSKFAIRVTDQRFEDDHWRSGQTHEQQIVQINERFELAKFVSHGTMSAVQKSSSGVALSAARRVSILFSDCAATPASEARSRKLSGEWLDIYLQATVRSRLRAPWRYRPVSFGDQYHAVSMGPQISQGFLNWRPSPFSSPHGLLAADIPTPSSVGFGIVSAKSILEPSSPAAHGFHRRSATMSTWQPACVPPPNPADMASAGRLRSGGALGRCDRTHCARLEPSRSRARSIRSHL